MDGRIGFQCSRQSFRGRIHDNQQPNGFVYLHHLEGKACPQITRGAVHHTQEAGNIVRQLRAASIPRWIDDGEVVLQIDSDDDRNCRCQHSIQHSAVWVGHRMVGHQECSPIEEQSPGEFAPADDAHGVCGMSVFRSRLGEVVRAGFDMGKRESLGQPSRKRLESSTTFVSIACPGFVETTNQPFQARLCGRGHQRQIKELDPVVTGVVLASHEPGRCWDRCSPRRQHGANPWSVRHVRESTGVGAPAATTARTTVMSGLMRVVEAD